MIPVRQTIFVADHPKRRGNCMSACLASILELPLDQTIDTTTDEVREVVGYHESIRLWLADRGLKFHTVVPAEGEEEAAELVGVYSICSGGSPRGSFSHAVVCKNGRLVFDPHPSDDGLTDMRYHEVIVPLSDAERRMHDHWLASKAAKAA